MIVYKIFLFQGVTTIKKSYSLSNLSSETDVFAEHFQDLNSGKRRSRGKQISGNSISTRCSSAKRPSSAIYFPEVELKGVNRRALTIYR